jgi:thioredoxin:protein disulfide reductase
MVRIRRLLPLLLALLLALGARGEAQALPPPLPVGEAFVLEAAPDADGGLALAWSIAEGYYLYREHLAAEDAAGAPLALETPAGVVKDDPTFGPTEVFYENLAATVAAQGGQMRVTYQGCQEDGLCYPPVTHVVLADGTVVADDAGPDREAWSSADAPEATAGSTAGLAGVTLAERSGGMLGALSERGGAALVVASFLGFGLLLAFTPCVLPMVPIVSAMLARQGERLTPRRGAALTGAYVLAMASAFGMLGMAAAWSGQNLQMALQTPWALGIVAAVFVALALAMFGLYELRLPAALTRRLERSGTGRRGSLGGAAALGFTSALIVGPCMTAPLAGALLYIAQTGDMALGAAALFALGLGQGIPLLLVGTLGAHVLPKAGPWMAGVNRLFGFVFLGMAVWLVARMVPGPVELALWAALLIAAAVFLGLLDRLPAEAGPGARAARAGGLVAALAGVVLGLGAAAGADDPMRPLAPFRSAGADGAGASPSFASVESPAALEAALASGGERPAAVYVTADWCVTCRAIERRVLPDDDVRAALDGMTLVKADVTALGREGRALLDALGAVGPPTMVFLDANRAEVEGSRLVGDVTVAGIARSAVGLR